MRGTATEESVKKKKKQPVGSCFACLAKQWEYGYTLIDSPMVICSDNHSAACFMGKHAQVCIQSSGILADMMPPAKMAPNHGSCIIMSQL